MKTLLLTLALLPLTVAASDAPDRAKIVAAVIGITNALLLDDEPEKCYLTEDRVDQNGNWSGVKVEVPCKPKWPKSCYKITPTLNTIPKAVCASAVDAVDRQNHYCKVSQYDWAKDAQSERQRCGYDRVQASCKLYHELKSELVNCQYDDLTY